ncbi:MAG: macro domain-containing protein [Planctomycetota bacterium]|nr:macro domain-containing protein [Planctomycetota bacterium]
MIHPVIGDILLSGAQAIAHGIAPNDPFDRGLALALRTQWPAMHKDYHHWANSHQPKPGEVWAWGGFGTRFYNLLTQDGGFEHGKKPGRATVRNVNHALKRLHELVIEHEITSLALPRLATGVGALDWDEVMPLIRVHLGALEIPVYVYETYHAGQKAVEPGLPVNAA